jgi:hypothetical protein
LNSSFASSPMLLWGICTLPVRSKNEIAAGRWRSDFPGATLAAHLHSPMICERPQHGGVDLHFKSCSRADFAGNKTLHFTPRI